MKTALATDPPGRHALYARIAAVMRSALSIRYRVPPPACPYTGWPQVDRDDLDVCACGHRHIRVEVWGPGDT